MNTATVASVVVPTYNRSGLLRRTLAALAAQTVPASAFEVIVADDGSSDDTRATVRSFERRLRMRYFWQEDLGFRAGAARNGGARLASASIIVFLDTGMLPGRDWLRAHIAAHAGGGTPGRAVAGYAYGYHPMRPCPHLAELGDEVGPDEMRARLGGLPSFRDMRHDELHLVDFDPARLAVPWFHFFTLNASVPAADFWAVGGFDDDFKGWGMEDLELGYRLSGRGVQMAFSAQAWGVEAPHPRNTAANLVTNGGNVARFADKHDHPLPELYWAIYGRRMPGVLEDEYRALLDWQDKAYALDVLPELTAIDAELSPEGGRVPRVAVLGCGGVLPPGWSSGAAEFWLCDFDQRLLRQAAAATAGRCATHHRLGVRLPLLDACADLVVITSRMAGVWNRWADDVVAEAWRIGREVRVLFAEPRVHAR